MHLAPLPLATHLHAPAQAARGRVQPDQRRSRRALYDSRTNPLLRQLLPQIDAFLPSDQEVRSLFGEGDRAVGGGGAAGRLGRAAGCDQDRTARAFCCWIGQRESGSTCPLITSQAILALSMSPAPAIPSAAGFWPAWPRAGDSLPAAQMGLVSASMVIEGYGALYALELDRETAFRRELSAL